MKSPRLGLSRRDCCSQDYRRGRSSQAVEHGAWSKQVHIVAAHLLQEAGRWQDEKRKERQRQTRANESRVTR